MEAILDESLGESDPVLARLFSAATAGVAPSTTGALAEYPLLLQGKPLKGFSKNPFHRDVKLLKGAGGVSSGRLRWSRLRSGRDPTALLQNLHERKQAREGRSYRLLDRGLVSMRGSPT